MNASVPGQPGQGASVYRVASLVHAGFLDHQMDTGRAKRFEHTINICLYNE